MVDNIRLKAVSYNCHDWALQMSAGFQHAHMCLLHPASRNWGRQRCLAQGHGRGRSTFCSSNVPTYAAWWIHQAPTAAQQHQWTVRNDWVPWVLPPKQDWVLPPKQGVTVGSHPRNIGRADRWMKACSMPAYFWQVVWSLLLISGSVKEPASSVPPPFPALFPSWPHVNKIKCNWEPTLHPVWCQTICVLEEEGQIRHLGVLVEGGRERESTSACSSNLDLRCFLLKNK